MTVTWFPGPPPGRGHWWVVWHGIVTPVEVDRSLIHRDNPDAKLLIKMLGGLAYDFAAQSKAITHHAALEAPEGP